MDLYEAERLREVLFFPLIILVSENVSLQKMWFFVNLNVGNK